VPVTINWRHDNEFLVRYPQGEEAVITSIPSAQRPGPGPSPMDMIQSSLAGCTGIDVVMILAKMRKTLEALRIEVLPTRREEPPRIFPRLELVYHVDGADIDEASVRRAVELSSEKYCSVSAMLRPTVELVHRIVLNGREVEPGTE